MDEMIKKPEMILFDYGQTLINEEPFDGEKGEAALMQYAVVNPKGLSAADVQREADVLNGELGRLDPMQRSHLQTEVPFYAFKACLYATLGIKLSLSVGEMERLFWDNASPGTAAEGIADFLAFLAENNIRTAVVSNISYSGEALRERIDRLIPNNRFEFIVASSEYAFRKPNSHIFDAALKKAGLSAEKIWFVGDNLVCDVFGSAKAGMRPAWYNPGGEKAALPEGAISAAGWGELRSLIEELT